MFTLNGLKKFIRSLHITKKFYFSCRKRGISRRQLVGVEYSLPKHLGNRINLNLESILSIKPSHEAKWTVNLTSAEEADWLLLNVWPLYSMYSYSGPTFLYKQNSERLRLTARPTWWTFSFTGYERFAYNASWINIILERKYKCIEVATMRYAKSVHHGKRKEITLGDI